jgi:hypothetical protein
MMLTKSRWLPLSAVCFNSGLTESKLLRASVVVKENINTVCLTVEQCHHKFLSLETGGYFFSGTFPIKGCYMKNRNVWFGSGGTDEEMAETELPGILTRVWCDIEAGTPTFTVAEISEPFASVVDSPTSKPMPNQLANIRSKRPTPQPSTTMALTRLVEVAASDENLSTWSDALSAAGLNLSGEGLGGGFGCGHIFTVFGA